MTAEKLTQDEIDALVNSNLMYPDVTTKLTSSVTPQKMIEVKTMLDRYYYALTHCSFIEQRIARENLRHAAFKVWLARHGFSNKTEYIRFMNQEAAKRGHNWHLHS